VCPLCGVFDTVVVLVRLCGLQRMLFAGVLGPVSLRDGRASFEAEAKLPITLMRHSALPSLVHPVATASMRISGHLTLAYCALHAVRVCRAWEPTSRARGAVV
jgi:hypothetical protein